MRVAIVSGYFNPLHVGHLDYIESAKLASDYLHVIVNSDEQVDVKGTVPFMNEQDRLRIIKSIIDVDEASIAIDKDGTVVESILELKNHYDETFLSPEIVFMNGGDRKYDNSPEDRSCNAAGILTLYNVGGDKVKSSSKIIRDSAKVHSK